MMDLIGAGLEIRVTVAPARVPVRYVAERVNVTMPQVTILTESDAPFVKEPRQSPQVIELERIP